MIASYCTNEAYDLTMLNKEADTDEVMIRQYVNV
jgi:hypothetical protein